MKLLYIFLFLAHSRTQIYPFARAPRVTHGVYSMATSNSSPAVSYAEYQAVFMPTDAFLYLLSWLAEVRFLTEIRMQLIATPGWIDHYMRCYIQMYSCKDWREKTVASIMRLLVWNTYFSKHFEDWLLVDGNQRTAFDNAVSQL